MTLGAVILGLALLSFFYLIVDGIVAPSERMLVRFGLFEAIEEIDALKKSEEQFSAPVAGLMRSTAHNLISHMPSYNIMMLARMHEKYAQDPALKDEARKRVQLLDSCQLGTVQALRKRIVRMADAIVIWNNAAWALYVVPVGLCFVMAEKFQKVLKAMITMPEKKLDQLNTSHAAF